MCVLPRRIHAFSFSGSVRARVFGGVYVYICVFSGARALTEFTLRHHAGTLNKCLNGRIVHYQPGVAG